MTYRIAFADRFYPPDLAQTWDGGSFESKDAAIAYAKAAIERDLRRFANGAGDVAAAPRFDTLMARYEAFAEVPLVFGPDAVSVFDSRSYASAYAREMVATWQGPSRQRVKASLRTRLYLWFVDLEPPRAPRWATAPLDRRKIFFGGVIVAVLIAVIRKIFGV